MSLKPKPLPEGGTIAIIAPSSRGDIEKLQPSIDALQMHGYKVQLHDQVHKEHNQSAGTVWERAEAIMDVFTDPAVDAVIAARGGNRSMHTLPLLDFAKIKNNPKPFVCFSDSTALVNAFYARTGLIGYHGPSLSRITRGTQAEQDQMIACLQGREQTLDFSSATTMHGGHVSGRLIGGNLSMMAALVGTPFMPDTTGAILFLEDIGDQLSRYDRMLAQLALSGALSKASAIMFGVMLPEGDSSVTPFGFEVADILREHTHGLKIPVIMDAPFGHKGPLWTLPIGGIATLNADTGMLTLEKTA
ncbi:MAG TPA: LD-carboxypeptidase [Alphaproteobacteria bacterium]